MAKNIISVIGGTGLQGGGVVNALLAQGDFEVRVATRNTAGETGRALAARGVEVVQADLLDPGSLAAAFAGAYGAFVVTNFWEQSQGAREAEIGAAAVRAARKAGVEHLIWSTLPDAEKASGGRHKVLHFTGKAHVDAVVRGAGFARHTFVEAPFYYQNFLGMMAPQTLLSPPTTLGTIFTEITGAQGASRWRGGGSSPLPTAQRRRGAPSSRDGRDRNEPLRLRAGWKLRRASLGGSSCRRG